MLHDNYIWMKTPERWDLYAATHGWQRVVTLWSFYKDTSCQVTMKFKNTFEIYGQ